MSNVLCLKSYRLKPDAIMKTDEIQEALSEVLDCAPEELRPETRLDAFAWDSMARVTFIAVARTRFGVKVSGAELAAFQTVGDVFAALER